ncbi:MAG: GNAT family N-acetyltransferase [Algisphaera sp.]
MEHFVFETWTAGQIAEDDFLAACELHFAAFPKPGRTLNEVVAKKRPVWMDVDLSPDAAADPPPQRHVLRENGKVLANAAVLVRAIETSAGLLTVCGLFDVATHPSARGRGLGGATVQTVFNAVDAGTYAFCVFQTGEARAFYEKLGAAVVDNRIVNSHAATDPEANPFTDTHVMRYPADTAGRTPWPEGLIDLRGPGY